MNQDVLAVVEVGGIGQAIARRQGSGKSVLLADFNEDTLANTASALQATGHRVTMQHVDVSSRESVHALAAAAAFLLGPEADFITGSDLLMDGGVIAALRAGRIQVDIG